MSKAKMSKAEKRRSDKIKRMAALLCADSPVIDKLIADMPETPFKTGGMITVDGESIRIKNKSYEPRQLQKITLSTEGSMRIFDRYGKKLCGTLALNLSSANIERFCLWARKHKIPAEIVSGRSEKFFQIFFLVLVTLIIVLIKLFSHLF